MIVSIPANARDVTVSCRKVRPSASATMGMMSVLRLTIVASILLITTRSNGSAAPADSDGTSGERPAAAEIRDPLEITPEMATRAQ